MTYTRIVTYSDGRIDNTTGYEGTPDEVKAQAVADGWTLVRDVTYYGDRVVVFEREPDPTDDET